VSAPAQSVVPEVFAGAAYDPTAADGLVAWQRPSGVALLARNGGAVGLPGRNPAVAPGRAGWRDADRLWVADATSLAPTAVYDAPGAGVFALSDTWLAWRTSAATGDELWARPATPDGEARRVAAARPPAELGRPALVGTLLLFHHAGPRGSRIVALDLAARRRTVLRREPGAMLTNPATDGARLLYVHATGFTQELRIGPLRPRAAARDAAFFVAPSPGQRDVEHEPGRGRHSSQPLPPLAPRGVDDTLWTTALTSTHAYVTRLRTQRDGPRFADILRVPALVAG
jgi:hypothetical protein